MLAGIGALLQRQGRFAFNNECIEIFCQQNCHGFRKGAGNSAFDPVQHIEKA